MSPWVPDDAAVSRLRLCQWAAPFKPGPCIITNGWSGELARARALGSFDAAVHHSLPQDPTRP